MADNFALAPALHEAEQPIDYSTRTGQNLYTQATAPLPYTFEGKTSSLPAFLQAIRDRSDASGWDDIFSITTGEDIEGNAIERNLLTQYGEITLNNVRTNAITDYMGTPVRNAQISHQIYQCLRKSITTEVNNRLVTEAEHFYIGDTPDGPSFLMTLINVYFVKTNATTTNLRLKIAEAHLLIAEHEYNIDAFNTEINGYIQRLAANGETTEDLFAHLTKAYRLVPDKEFQAYIRERIDGHNDGTVPLTTTQLMERAKTKYDALIASENWMSQDPTEKQLVVLTAQLQQVQEKNKALQRQLRGTPKKSGPSDKKGPKKNAKPNQPDKWAWKVVKPRPNQATTKVFEGKTYFWCPHHQKWTLHKPDECRLNKDKSDGKPRNAGAPAGTPSAASLSAVLDEGSFSEE